VKKIAQPIFAKIHTKSMLIEKSRTKKWATSVIFKKLPIVQKCSPIGRKFSQSCHPDCIIINLVLRAFKPVSLVNEEIAT
jgi:hypothetical protein